ncbi:MAG: hypothetical protein GY713_11820, partial [Actinomycetia bacterium]|nr:hypothetical protein [Actinomycetes bacterium]
MSESATYRCEIGQWNSTVVADPWNPIPDTGPVNDMIRMTSGDMLLGGTLDLTAVSKLHPPIQAPGQPEGVMVEWYGDQTRRITAASGEDSVMYAFDALPDAQPETWDDIITGTPEWSQGHIGRGVFLTTGGPAQNGVTFGGSGTDVHLFQACDGDTNGDRNLNGRDIQNIQSWLSFGQPGAGPGPNGEWDWQHGDFNGDTVVDGLDISAILSTGLWPSEGYAAVEPGERGDDIVDIVLDPSDGSLTIDTGQMTINGYVIRSAAGIFTGGPAENLGWFVEDTDSSISGNMGFTLTGEHPLGTVVGSEWII